MKILLLAILSTFSLTPPPPNLDITVHDAAGRTFIVHAHWNSLVFGAGGNMTLDVQTDSLFCGNLEP